MQPSSFPMALIRQRPLRDNPRPPGRRPFPPRIGSELRPRIIPRLPRLSIANSASEAHAATEAEGPRRPVLAHEPGRRKPGVRKRDRNITCVERVPDPRLGEQPAAPDTAPEAGQ